MEDEGTATFEARDPRVVDEMIDSFRMELREKKGKVIHTQTHINPDIKMLARLIAQNLAAIMKGQEPKTDDNDVGLIYSYAVVYKKNMDDEQYERIKDVLPQSTEKLKMRVKKENADNKLWCTCPMCKQRWAWNYFSHCRCGNNMPPTETRKEYETMWK